MTETVIGIVPLLAVDHPAVPHRVGRIRAEVCDFAIAHGASGALVDDIALAVTEAAANVVRHAYPEGDDGLIHVVADVEDGIFEIVVSDDGTGFRPGRSTAGAGLGAGLSLIAGCAASFGIESGEDGVEVWMRFFLPRS